MFKALMEISLAGDIHGKPFPSQIGMFIERKFLIEE